MFGAAAKKAAAYAKLRQMEAAFAELEAAHNALLLTVATLRNRPVLIGIERTGKLNHFTFIRDGKITDIETFGTLSDDVNAWKKELLG